MSTKEILDRLSEALPIACLYEELKAAGVPLDSHESDLYFPETEQTLAILGRHEIHRQNARRLMCLTDNGAPWIEVPFAFMPWWATRAGEGGQV